MVFLVMFLLFVVQQICARNEQEHATNCLPSSCGKIANISRPFRLKGDPIYCGDNRYELDCENNVTVLYLYGGKYHVQAINYNNFTVRVVDPGVEEQSFSLPRYFLSQSNFTDNYRAVDPYRATQTQLSKVSFNEKSLLKHIIFMNCSHRVSENYKYVNTTPWVKWETKGYMYAIAGDLTAADFEVGCRIKLLSPTSWWGLHANHSSYSMMNTALLYGFEMSWQKFACEDQCDSPYGECYFDSSTLKLQCSPYCDDIFGVLETKCGKGIHVQVQLIFLITRNLLHTHTCVYI